jgi:hypothetical protein
MHPDDPAPGAAFTTESNLASMARRKVLRAARRPASARGSWAIRCRHRSQGPLLDDARAPLRMAGRGCRTVVYIAFQEGSEGSDRRARPARGFLGQPTIEILSLLTSRSLACGCGLRRAAFGVVPTIAAA